MQEDCDLYDCFNYCDTHLINATQIFKTGSYSYGWELKFSGLDGNGVFAISCNHKHLYPFEYSVETQADRERYLNVQGRFKSQYENATCDSGSVKVEPS